MRYLKGKNVVIIWDLIDDLKGYSVKHSEARLNIYKDQKFEVLNSQHIHLNDFKDVK